MTERPTYPAREAREKRGLTAQEVADRLGISADLVRKAERGRAGSADTVRRIAEIVDCNLAYYAPPQGQRSK